MTSVISCDADMSSFVTLAMSAKFPIESDERCWHHNMTALSIAKGSFYCVCKIIFILQTSDIFAGYNSWYFSALAPFKPCNNKKKFFEQSKTCPPTWLHVCLHPYMHVSTCVSVVKCILPSSLERNMCFYYSLLVYFCFDCIVSCIIHLFCRTAHTLVYTSMRQMSIFYGYIEITSRCTLYENYWLLGSITYKKENIIQDLFNQNTNVKVVYPLSLHVHKGFPLAFCNTVVCLLFESNYNCLFPGNLM